MPGTDEGVENFNVEDEEVARDTIVQNPDLLRQHNYSPQITPEDERVQYIVEMYKQLQSCLLPQQLLHVEISHLILSYALGIPVGIVKT